MYHFVLKNVPGVDVSENGIRIRNDAILGNWTLEIPVFCKAATVFTSTTVKEERYPGYISITIQIKHAFATPANIQLREGIQALEDV